MNTTVNQFTYTVSNIALTAANDKTYTAAQAAVRLPLSAYYSIQPGPQAVGMSSVIAVYEKDGSPAAGVTVYLDGNEIGKTDANGLLQTDAMKAKEVGTVCTLTAIGTKGVGRGDEGHRSGGRCRHGVYRRQSQRVREQQHEPEHQLAVRHRNGR